MTMTLTARQGFVKIADTYGKARRLSRATVSKRFHGDHNFIDDFSRGRCSVTIKKLAGMVDAIFVDWPADLPWPETTPIRLAPSDPDALAKKRKAVD